MQSTGILCDRYMAIRQNLSQDLNFPYQMLCFTVCTFVLHFDAARQAPIVNVLQPPRKANC